MSKWVNGLDPAPRGRDLGFALAGGYAGVRDESGSGMLYGGGGGDIIDKSSLRLRSERNRKIKGQTQKMYRTPLIPPLNRFSGVRVHIQELISPSLIRPIIEV